MRELARSIGLKAGVAIGVVGCAGDRVGQPDAGLAERHEDGTITAMPMTLDQIVEETRSLPHDVVNDLVDRIMFAAHGGQDQAQSRAWSDTVQRRIGEIESGQAQLIPLEDALAQARQRLGR